MIHVTPHTHLKVNRGND